MSAVWVLNRRPTANAVTFGHLNIDGQPFCFTLEDAIREVAGVPVIEWKIPKETCIPQGTYELTFENSPKFGPDTITVNRVPGFEAIRIHGGNRIEDTEGCVIVGSHIDTVSGTIAGAKVDGVLSDLKAKLHVAIAKYGTVSLQITNPL